MKAINLTSRSTTLTPAAARRLQRHLKFARRFDGRYASASLLIHQAFPWIHVGKIVAGLRHAMTGAL